MATTKALVTGAGGFIGGHLVRRLLDEGYEVRCVDIKYTHESAMNEEGAWWQVHPEAQYVEGSVWGDLREKPNCQRACEGIDEVYNLAADMGGIGFIENHKFRCMQSVSINTHLSAAPGRIPLHRKGLPTRQGQSLRNLLRARRRHRRQRSGHSRLRSDPGSRLRPSNR